jgi:hypothetical protein
MDQKWRQFPAENYANNDAQNGANFRIVIIGSILGG